MVKRGSGENACCAMANYERAKSDTCTRSKVDTVTGAHHSSTRLFFLAFECKVWILRSRLDVSKREKFVRGQAMGWRKIFHHAILNRLVGCKFLLHG
jgi:hypothetical protein